MKMAMLGMALLLGAAVPGQANSPRPFQRGTPVTLVGEISSQPRNAMFTREGKMQVAVGPEKVDHTLHMEDAKLYGPEGREIAISDLRDKWWVRANGTLMDDPRRIRVTRLEVLAHDWEGYRKSADWKQDWERGYVQTRVGKQQIYSTTRVFPQGTRVVLVGKVSSQPRDVAFAHEEKMQVAVGSDQTDFTLHLDGAELRGLQGEEIGVSDLRDKMWIRAEGMVMDDSRRIQVTRLEVTGGEHPLWGLFYAPGGIRSAGSATPAGAR